VRQMPFWPSGRRRLRRPRSHGGARRLPGRLFPGIPAMHRLWTPGPDARFRRGAGDRISSAMSDVRRGDRKRRKSGLSSRRRRHPLHLLRGRPNVTGARGRIGSLPAPGALGAGGEGLRESRGPGGYQSWPRGHTKAGDVDAGHDPERQDDAGAQRGRAEGVPLRQAAGGRPPRGTSNALATLLSDALSERGRLSRSVARARTRCSGWTRSPKWRCGELTAAA
jgi:hypothetical protein